MTGLIQPRARGVASLSQTPHEKQGVQLIFTSMNGPCFRDE
ncbi:hypothetical protein GbCGDNIH3_7271 [Granulibacter bethesdensis]|uniref:Uncharacterized protein n=1 Tax=Granulibacter bethesdensis TaxID=364410 RepID=A0AAN0REH7_9PROT|nr:hypothetical protein GbCGDNIH3_7271 [Granulibacter bethesdensis]